jgi:hypothetical protein
MIIKADQFENGGGAFAQPVTGVLQEVEIAET